MLTSTLAGFTASIALIAAIGAQNAFVLRQGLRRQHVLPVVLTCAASDALLISLGIAGLGAAIADRPAVAGTVRWVGAAFLICYALFAARRALRPDRLTPTDHRPVPLRTTIAMCLAFTYLNPHVYLDTVLLLGSVANQYDNRWLFGSGAVLASVVWFTALGYGAHRLAPALSRPGAWRVVDGLVAALMAALAIALLRG
ncbi:LysE/ArgO family amino acid transporter [Micromonospora sp. NPDC004704]